MLLSSVVFRNMSSEQERQSATGPRPGERAADPAADPAAAPVTDAPAKTALTDGTSAGTGPDGPRQLTDPIVLRALAHPVRTALLELLSVLDTLTATQASEMLGESPANCAFHLRTLAKYGFAEEAGGGRGRERPWKAAQREISVTTKQADPQAAMAADALTQLWFEQWVDRARQLFRSSAVVPGWEQASGWQRNAVFITPEETVDLRREIGALIKKYDPRRSNPSLRPPTAMPVDWSVFVAPVPELAELIEKQARESGDGAGGRLAREPEADA
jgi:Helix-turn-helix domain